MSSSGSPSPASTAADQPQSVSDPTPGAPDRSPDPLTTDEVFDLLRNQRRRSVLRYFRDRERSVTTLGDLSEHVAAREFETAPADLTAAERKRVYVGLYQCHLPRMDEAGVVAFDDDRKTVTLGPNADVLLTYLGDRDEDTTDARPDRRYLAVALAGTVLFGLSELGVASAGLTPRLVLGGVLVAVAALALAPPSAE